MAFSDAVGAAPAWSVTSRMLLLTISLLGLQFTWTIELAQGTPFLLSLGLPKSYSAMVWIAGPLSGFVMQPIVGAYSDACRSRFGRRRPFMVAGSLVVIFAFMVIGWTREIAALLTGGGEWTNTTAQTIAVLAFYVLDFAINTVQASCRALILDAAGKQNQETATAWAGRMIGAGNVGGYLMGYFNLVDAFPFFGNTQLKVLCIVGSSILAFCVGLTCCTIKENLSIPPRAPVHGNPFYALASVLHSLRRVPPTVQRLCNVQFFAWIGWFPFLFYTTSWITEVLARSSLANPVRGSPIKITEDAATRAGSFALFMFSIVSLASSTLLPFAVAGSHVGYGGGEPRLHGNIPRDGDSGNVDEPSSYNCSQKRPVMDRVRGKLRNGVSLTTVYTASHFLFAACMLLTPMAYNSVQSATLLVAVCGIPWSAAMWAPFCILGESVAGKAPIQLRRRARETNGKRHEKSQSLVPAATYFAENLGEHERASTDMAALHAVAEGKCGEPRTPFANTRRDMERKRNGGSLGLTAGEHAIPPVSVSTPSNTLLVRSKGDVLRSRNDSPCRIHVRDEEAPLVAFPGGPEASGFTAIRNYPNGDSAVVESDDDKDDSTEADDDWAFEACDILGRGVLSTTTAPNTADGAPRDERTEFDGGTILGIHNCYCVAPQFITALLSSVIFAAMEPTHSPSAASHSALLLSPPKASPPSALSQPRIESTLADIERDITLQGTDAIAWVLRLGGLSALVAAYLSLKIK